MPSGVTTSLLRITATVTEVVMTILLIQATVFKPQFPLPLTYGNCGFSYPLLKIAVDSYSLGDSLF